MKLTLEELREKVEAYAATPKDQKLPRDAKKLIDVLLDFLERGEVRAAAERAGKWEAVPWVKRGILLGFRAGELEGRDAGDGVLTFVDKDTYPTRQFDVDQEIRIVPGGSSVRRGAFLARGVVCM